MSVVPIDKNAKGADRAPKRRGFWGGLAQTLELARRVPNQARVI